MRNIHFGFLGVVLVSLISVFGYSNFKEDRKVTPPDCKCSEGCKCKLEKCLCATYPDFKCDSTGCKCGDKK